ncbi:MAG TPA: hypothetical protein VM287_05965 [Egibacteraceae bacterium]|nr:hypothetical protein [Egibacteraceae bacterium]
MTTGKNGPADAPEYDAEAGREAEAAGRRDALLAVCAEHDLLGAAVLQLAAAAAGDFVAAGTRPRGRSGPPPPPRGTGPRGGTSSTRTAASSPA